MNFTRREMLSMMTAAGAESPDTVRGHGHHPAADAEAPAAVSSAAGPFPVGVEFRAGLDRVVASYLGLQTALAADDPVGASDAAGALAAALAAVDAAGLAASAAAAWSDDRGQGRDSVMLAPTRDLVAQLNHHARLLRHHRSKCLKFQLYNKFLQFLRKN